MNKNNKNIRYILILVLIYIALMTLMYSTYGISNIENILFWVFLAIIAESFIIVSSTETITSVSVAIYLYIASLGTPFDVMLIATIATITCFPEIRGKRKHIFNTDIKNTIFNISNISISMGISAVILQIYKYSSNIILLFIIMSIALMIAEILNAIMLSGYFLTQSKKLVVKEIVKSILGSYFNTLAIGTLGIFLVFADYTYGKSIVIILFVPLLLARYSFKLYYDSQRMAIDTIHALNEALHAKDAYTGGHTGRVQQYAMDIAKAYKLTPNQIDTIDKAALLHDIGKIGIPDDILNKAGKLTDEEYRRIQDHASIGGHIIGSVHSLRKIAQIIIQHHERFDGKGYPNQLTGDQISIEASILMIADSFDAMTSDRPYRKAFTKEHAIKELTDNAGIQFHPKLIECFVNDVLSEPGYQVGEIQDNLVDIEVTTRSERMKEA